MISRVPLIIYDGCLVQVSLKHYLVIKNIARYSLLYFAELPAKSKYACCLSPHNKFRSSIIFLISLNFLENQLNYWEQFKVVNYLRSMISCKAVLTCFDSCTQIHCSSEDYFIGRLDGISLASILWKARYFAGKLSGFLSL